MTSTSADQLPRSARSGSRNSRSSKPASKLPLMIGAAVLLIALGVGGGWLLNSKDDSTPKVATSGSSSAALTAGLQAQVQGDNATAKAKFKEAVQLDPSNKFAYYNLALVEQTEKDLTAAEADYRKTIELDPKYAPALYNLGIIVSDSGNKVEAIDLYRRATASDPKFARAYLNLGLLLFDTGDVAGSADALSKAVTLDPTLRTRIPANAQPAG